MLRLKTLRDERVGRKEDSVERGLGVETAAPPEDAVDDLTAERVVIPLGLVYRNHVVVGHQHGGLALCTTWPLIEQSTTVEARERAGLVHMGVQLGKHADELVELCLVLEGMVVVRDRLAANEAREGVHESIHVDCHRFGVARLLLGWNEPGSTGSKDCSCTQAQ